MSADLNLSHLPEDVREHLRSKLPATQDDGRRPAPSPTATTTISSSVVRLGDVERQTPSAGWIWDGYISPGEVTALQAKPKIGKSTLLFDLLRCLRRGDPCAGRGTRPSRVLYITEEAAGTIEDKRAKFELDGEAGDHVGVLIRRQLGAGVTWSDLVGAAHALHDEYDLVVFDTYHTLAGFRGDEENGSGGHHERLAPIFDLAGAGPAVVLVTHERKAEGSIQDRGRGGNALASHVDILLSLEKVKDDPTARTIEATGRYDATPDLWTIRLEDDRFVSVGGSIAQETKRREYRSLAQEVAAAGNDKTAQEMAPILGLSPRATKRRLDAAFEEDELQRTGTGSKTDPHRYGVHLMVVMDVPLTEGDDDHHPGALSFDDACGAA
jgi:AAA domain-containing protein